MTNADWWARVVQARTQHADLLPQRACVIRKDGHAAAIDLRAMPGIGAELVLCFGIRGSAKDHGDALGGLSSMSPRFHAAAQAVSRRG